MNTKPRYATVKKFATRELLSKEFQHAVFGAKINTEYNTIEIQLAKTPEEIVYFLDDDSYKEFVNKILREFSIVVDVCAVHR